MRAPEGCDAAVARFTSAFASQPPLAASWSAITASAEVMMPSRAQGHLSVLYVLLALLRDQEEGGGSTRCVCHPYCVGMRMPGRWGDHGCWRVQALRLRMAAGKLIKIEKRFS